MGSFLLVANGLFALISGAASLLSAVRPGLGLPAGEPVTAGVRFYSAAYAVRAAPLSVAGLILLATQAHSAGLVAMLVVLGVAQAGDSVLGVRQRNWGMTAGAGAAALVHLASAWIVARG
jgi:hypothetical protein